MTSSFSTKKKSSRKWHIRHHLYGEKLPQVGTVTHLPELPWASQHFLDFLTGTWRTVTRETKRLARLELFFDGKISLQAGRTRGH